MTARRTVVLVSGGIDSVTALYESVEVDKVVAAVSFRYGSKHNQQELRCANWHCKRVGVPQEIVPLDCLDNLFSSDLLKSGGEIPEGHYQEETMKQTVVPFRNGILLAIAAGYAENKEADALVIGAHTGDHAIYPDCRPAFMDAMGESIRLGTYTGVELLRPFIDMTKTDIVQRGNKLGVIYAKTWSCYKGGACHCGKCGTCVERREAFQNAGVSDPTEYAETGPLPTAPEEK